MNYEVTALKKRPQNFDDFVGQDFVVETLKNSLESKRIANAFLFSGPRGVGKTSAARVLAKALNCSAGITSSPCGKCSSCTEITAGNALDVIEIDGASHTSVNDVREIRDEVLFAPSSSRYKIYIIDEVHMLSNNAFNALLKTIEEPPPYIVFIFATTEIHKVPATIRSRCQQYNFRLISIDEIINKLQTAIQDMKIEADAESLIWIAKEATGSLRDAYTLFDQVVSFADGKIQLKKIQEKLGIVGMEEIEVLIAAIAEKKSKPVIEIVNTIIAKGISEEQVLISLAEYFRNLLLLNSGITKESLLGYSLESFKKDIINAFTTAQIEKSLTLIFELLRSLKFSLNQKFELELLVQRLCNISRYITPEEILHRLEHLKNQLGAGTVNPVSAPASLPKHPIQVDSSDDYEEDDDQEESDSYSVMEPGILTGDTLLVKMIEAIRRKKLALASALQKNVQAKIDGTALSIFFHEADRYSFEFVTKERMTLTELAGSISGKKLSVETLLMEKDLSARKEDQDDSENIIKKVFKGSVIQEN
ncbi:MAG: DNA polymerase III subunit gamma/tau [Spirochaetales bacterium]|nr:DNA polymerase III subunit gamma/tau [Spirochaetales bacterium]